MLNKEHRMNTWRKSQAESGKKRMDVYVTEDVHQNLKEIRQETGASYGDIIGKLLAGEVKSCHQTVTIQIPEKAYRRLVLESDEDGLIKWINSKIQAKYEELVRFDEDDF